MSAFDRLDPLVQHHIVNSIGWRSLRALQEKSIEPVLAGKHCLLLAPTAGGKTEAVMFPLLSRIVSERWERLSVIYVCPLKALLNNLQLRLEGYAGLLGRHCEVWHGDVSASRKNHIRAAAPDILLTTPESLEGMLVSTNPAGREMLKTVQAVVVDEIHAFAGDDRGWHLLAVLERVTRLAGREIQRVGLSATVGNPVELLDWFAGHCAGDREVVAPETDGALHPEVLLDYVGNLENAATVISRLHRGEKRLVFCDSRSRVEELARLLRSLGVETYLSHSSLSVEERRAAEKAFAESRNCVIVSTSTLELGIDVGDLDRVVQIDAPGSVASFLQRLGRTGRRSGSPRNCLLLATSEKALLKAASLLELWTSGFVEPIQPPPLPLHIFSQQLMALSLQLGGVGAEDWQSWIGRLPAFAAIARGQELEIVRFLEDSGILFRDSGILAFGAEGEVRYGRRHFLELLSVFSSPAMLTALHGSQDLGQIEAGFLVRVQEGSTPAIALGGRSWAVRHIDWRTRRVFVEPSVEEGRGAWIGCGQGMSPHLARAARRVLTGSVASNLWSTRAVTALTATREEYAFLAAEGCTLAVFAGGRRIEWFTFAGGKANDLLAQGLLRHGGIHGQPNDLSIVVADDTPLECVQKAIAALTAEDVIRNAGFDDEAIDALKFHECLPPSVRQDVMRKRWVNEEVLRGVVSGETRTVIHYAPRRS